MTGIELHIRVDGPVTGARALVSGEALEVRAEGAEVAVMLPRLERFETIVLER